MSARIAHRELRELADAMRAIGWCWEHTGSGHLRWRHPEVQGPVFTASTPRAGGAHKERQKLQTALRRAREAQHA